MRKLVVAGMLAAMTLIVTSAPVAAPHIGGTRLGPAVVLWGGEPGYVGDLTLTAEPLDPTLLFYRFDTNADGSTRRIFVQLSNFHGFAAVDFATGQEVARIEHPAIPGVHAHRDGLQTAPAHGLGVTPDGKQLWSTSKVYGYAYVHSLPDLKEIARVYVGQHPEWVTFSRDGRRVYVAAAGDNQTFVVDTTTFKEVARIPVGQVPKRNATVVLKAYQ